MSFVSRASVTPALASSASTPQSTFNPFSGYGAADSDVKRHPAFESGRTPKTGERSNEESERVKVVLRVRPALRDEDPGALLLPADPNGTTVTLHRPDAPIAQAEFKFDKVLHPSATQHDVYMAGVRDVVDDVLQGYNGTVMAYGQTGAGKTFTLGNTEPTAIGMIPRCIAEIFKTASGDPFHSYTVTMSYIQIYMEMIQDLLLPDSENLLIREDLNNGVFVAGVQEVAVASLEECLHYLELGERNRVFAFTHLNAHSSRSHAVVMVTVVRSRKYLTNTEKAQMKKGEKDGVVSQKVKVGKLYLVDLAGSERLKKSGSVGVRATEAKSINLSLTTLGMCISARANDERHVPFRDSKLTRLLQESLGGNAKTTLVLCAADAKQHVDETLQSLQFGSRAMCVKNKPVVNERMDYRMLHSELLAQMDRADDRSHALEVAVLRTEEERDALKAALEAQKAHHDAIIRALRAEGDDRVAAVNSEMDGLRAEMSVHRTRRGELEARLRELQADNEHMVSKHREVVTGLKTQIKDILAAQAETAARNARDAATAAAEMQATQHELQAAKTDIVGLQAQLAAAHQTLASVHAWLQQLGVTVAPEQPPSRPAAVDAAEQPTAAGQTEATHANGLQTKKSVFVVQVEGEAAVPVPPTDGPLEPPQPGAEDLSLTGLAAAHGSPSRRLAPSRSARHHSVARTLLQRQTSVHVPGTAPAPAAGTALRSAASNGTADVESALPPVEPPAAEAHSLDPAATIAALPGMMDRVGQAVRDLVADVRATHGALGDERTLTVQLRAEVSELRDQVSQLKQQLHERGDALSGVESQLSAATAALERERTDHSALRTLHHKLHDARAALHGEQVAVRERNRAARTIQQAYRGWRTRRLQSAVNHNHQALTQLEAAQKAAAAAASAQTAQLGASIVLDSMTVIREAVEALLTTFVGTRKELDAREQLAKRVGSAAPILSVARTNSMLMTGPPSTATTPRSTPTASLPTTVTEMKRTAASRAASVVYGYRDRPGPNDMTEASGPMALPRAITLAASFSSAVPGQYDVAAARGSILSGQTSKLASKGVAKEAPGPSSARAAPSQGRAISVDVAGRLPAGGSGGKQGAQLPLPSLQSTAMPGPASAPSPSVVPAAVARQPAGSPYAR